jgi:hypothetical protein
MIPQNTDMGTRGGAKEVRSRRNSGGSGHQEAMMIDEFFKCLCESLKGRQWRDLDLYILHDREKH